MKQTDKTNMEEIRIYQSSWKRMLVAIGCLAFAACGWLMIHDANATWPTKIGGLGGMVLFGCGGIFMLLLTLYNGIRHIPLLIIYDDRLDFYVQRKRAYQSIYFRDVERFSLTTIHSNKFITIDYTEKALKRKMEEASGFTQLVMEFNAHVSGGIESLPGEELTMKGKAIYELLNNRLEAWRSQYGNP